MQLEALGFVRLATTVKAARASHALRQRAGSADPRRSSLRCGLQLGQRPPMIDPKTTPRIGAPRTLRSWLSVFRWLKGLAFRPLFGCPVDEIRGDRSSLLPTIAAWKPCLSFSIRQLSIKPISRSLRLRMLKLLPRRSIRRGIGVSVTNALPSRTDIRQGRGRCLLPHLSH